MKQFKEFEMEIVEFDELDIITASDSSDDGWGEDGSDIEGGMGWG